MLLHGVAVWSVLLAAAFANGIVRVAWLVPRTGEAAGHIISSLTLAAAIAVLAWVSIQWVEPSSAGDALVLGAVLVLCKRLRCEQVAKGILDEVAQLEAFQLDVRGNLRRELDELVIEPGVADVHTRQRCALARREVLQRGDERQADAPAQGRELEGIGVGGKRARIGNRFQPMRPRAGLEGIVHRADRAFLHRAHPARSVGERVETDVRGDAIEPRPDRRSP